MPAVPDPRHDSERTTSSTPARHRAPRIALVCDYFLDYLGGAQTALIEQAHALRAAGAYVIIVAPTARGRRRVDTGAVRWIRLAAPRSLPGLQLPLIADSRRLRDHLRRVFAEHRIEVVHAHAEFGVTAAAFAVAGELGLRTAQTVHTFFWRAPGTGVVGAVAQGAVRILAPVLHRRLTGLRTTRRVLADRPGDSALRNLTLTVAEQAGVVISPSTHQAERLRAAGLTRVEVIPNTVAGLPAARPVSEVTRPLRVLWIGRCAPEKRVVAFAQAARIAADQLGPGRLEVLVVGDGEDLGAARAAAAGAVRFTGRRTRAEIERLIAGAHVTAITSVGFDNQPMTIVESVIGLRGVVYCDPALTEGLDGPGIASGPSPRELADTLTTLASAPDRVVAASRAAFAARQEFSPEVFARSTFAAYDRVGRGGDRPARGPNRGCTDVRRRRR